MATPNITTCEAAIVSAPVSSTVLRLRFVDSFSPADRSFFLKKYGREKAKRFGRITLSWITEPNGMFEGRRQAEACTLNRSVVGFRSSLV